MRELSIVEIEFFKGLLEYSPRLINGYYHFQPRNLKYGQKKYKRNRITAQLHFKVFLERWEIVHHIDGNKTNDSIENLQIMTDKEHGAHHYLERIKVLKLFNKNKLSNKKIKKIHELSKTIIRRDGTPHYAKIGREVGIAGFTVARYIKKQINSLLPLENSQTTYDNLNIEL